MIKQNVILNQFAYGFFYPSNTKELSPGCFGVKVQIHI